MERSKCDCPVCRAKAMLASVLMPPVAPQGGDVKRQRRMGELLDRRQKTKKSQVYTAEQEKRYDLFHYRTEVFYEDLSRYAGPNDGERMDSFMNDLEALIAEVEAEQGTPEMVAEAARRRVVADEAEAAAVVLDNRIGRAKGSHSLTPEQRYHLDQKIKWQTREVQRLALDYPFFAHESLAVARSIQAEIGDLLTTMGY